MIKSASAEFCAEVAPLNRKSVNGWELVGIDSGIFIFRREGYCIFEDVNGRLEYRELGPNS